MDTRTAADSRRARRGVVALLAFGLLAAVPAASAQTTGGGSEPTGGTPPATVAPQPSGSPDPAFRGNGMWIWQLPRVYGGSVSRIVAKARRHGVTTLFLKSGDGLHRWGQFSPGVVQAFKSAGLHVCGWQYVYGNSPIGERLGLGEAGGSGLLRDRRRGRVPGQVRVG